MRRWLNITALCERQIRGYKYDGRPRPANPNPGANPSPGANSNPGANPNPGANAAANPAATDEGVHRTVNSLLPIALTLVLTWFSSATANGQGPLCDFTSVLQPGDANLDLQFDTDDFVLVMALGKYLTGQTAAWEEGDWNGDGVFDDRDLVLALSTGNFEVGPYALLAGGPPPSPRGGAPAAWLLELGQRPQMMLFGGMDPITNDTHVFDPAAGWREVTDGTAPGARCHHSLVVDGDGNALVFGGFSRQGRFNDTQRFDPLTMRWTELPAQGAIPAKRCLHAAAWIPTTNEMMIYGGIKGGGGFAEDYFLNTSVLDLGTGQWTEVNDDSPPGARAGAIAFYSSSDRAVFLWGGLQSRGLIANSFEDFFIGYLNELWRYDPIQRTWATVAVTGEIPEGREDPTYFWDDTYSRLYLFHGFNKVRPRGSRLMDDAYVLDVAARRWQRLETTGESPPLRWRGSVAVDPLKGHGWLYGGWDAVGERNDTWRFDLQTQHWTKVCIPGSQ